MRSARRRNRSRQYPGGLPGRLAAMRASAGVSILWNSPLGPLRLDIAKAFKKEAYDDEQLSASAPPPGSRLVLAGRLQDRRAHTDATLGSRRRMRRRGGLCRLLPRWLRWSIRGSSRGPRRSARASWRRRLGAKLAAGADPERPHPRRQAARRGRPRPRLRSSTTASICRQLAATAGRGLPDRARLCRARAGGHGGAGHGSALPRLRDGAAALLSGRHAAQGGHGGRRRAAGAPHRAARGGRDQSSRAR